MYTIKQLKKKTLKTEINNFFIFEDYNCFVLSNQSKLKQIQVILKSKLRKIIRNYTSDPPCT